MSSKKKKPIKGQSVLQNQNIWMFAIIVILGFILYSNTLNHGFVLDDPIITTENKFVNEGFGGLKDIFSHGYLYGFNGENDQSYRPLVLANLAIETALFGSNPKVYHFFNVLFYIFTGLMIYLFLNRLFQKESKLLSLTISLLFIAHPIHTEVVANIKSRDEILSFLFAIISLYYLFRHSDHRKIKHYILSIIFFFLSILSKETSLAFLAIVPLSLFFYRSKSWKEISLTSLPFLLTVLVYFSIRTAALDAMVFESGMDKINNSLMASSGSELWATKIMILGKYIALLLFPHPLSYDYSFNQVQAVGLADWKFILSLISYIGLITFSIYGFFKKNPLAYGVLFFLLLLILVSNLLIIIGATMAERFIYASSFGFTFVLGYILYKYIDRKYFFYLLGMLLFFYSLKTISRNADWKTSRSLYESGIITAPNSARAANHLGTYHRQEAEQNRNPMGRNKSYQEALKYYKKALIIYPQYREAEYNTGVCYYALGMKEKSKACYERILKYEPNNLNTLNNMGVYYFEKKEYEKGIEYWERVLDINHHDLLVLANIAAAYFNLANHEKAIEYQLQILEIEPNNRKAINLIIRSYGVLGNVEKVNEYQQKLR